MTTNLRCNKDLTVILPIEIWEHIVSFLGEVNTKDAPRISRPNRRNADQEIFGRATYNRHLWRLARRAIWYTVTLGSNEIRAVEKLEYLIEYVPLNVPYGKY